MSHPDVTVGMAFLFSVVAPHPQLNSLIFANNPVNLLTDQPNQ